MFFIPERRSSHHLQKDSKHKEDSKETTYGAIIIISGKGASKVREQPSTEAVAEKARTEETGTEQDSHAKEAPQVSHPPTKRALS